MLVIARHPHAGMMAATASVLSVASWNCGQPEVRTWLILRANLSAFKKMATARESWRAVTDKPPSASELRKLLGDAYPAFQALVSRAERCAAEWRRYSNNSPWVLKVSDGKRSLFYAQPESGYVKVTVLLGGRAVEAALSGSVSRRLHTSIRAAKVYPEGRPVVVDVKRSSDLANVEELVAVKVAAASRRAKKSRSTTTSASSDCQDRNRVRTSGR